MSIMCELSQCFVSQDIKMPMMCELSQCFVSQGLAVLITSEIIVFFHRVWQYH